MPKPGCRTIPRSTEGASSRPLPTTLNPGGCVMPTKVTAFLPGVLWGLAAVLIWAGWWVLTRFSVTGSLRATDLAALRFGLAGLVMLPVFLRHRTAIAHVPKLLLF